MFSFSVFSPLRVLNACRFIHNPLWIQGLKKLVLWILNLTLLVEQGLFLVEQGLWTQVSVLYSSGAKAVLESHSLQFN